MFFKHSKRRKRNRAEEN